MVYAFQATDVYRPPRFDPPLMVVLSPALAAEVRVRHIHLELIQAESIGAFQRCVSHKGTKATTAARRRHIERSSIFVNDPIQKVQVERHCPAMADPMPQLISAADQLIIDVSLEW